MKDISLDKNGQLSLICFLGVLVLQPIMLVLFKLGFHSPSMPIVIYIIAFSLLAFSLFFGIKSLKESKFVLFWIIPTSVYLLIFVISIGMGSLSKKEIISYPRKQIGIYLDWNNNGIIHIDAVKYKSKAEKAGLKGGDIITRINSEIIDNEQISDVVNMIGTDTNNVLHIEVKRDGIIKSFDIDMTEENSNSVPTKPLHIK